MTEGTWVFRLACAKFLTWIVLAVFDGCLTQFMSPRCPMVGHNFAVARFNLVSEI